MIAGKLKRNLNVQLINRAPDVYIGPEARSALTGTRGLLLGSKRMQAVDVLRFECCSGVSAMTVLKRRWQQTVSWEIVGVSLSLGDIRSYREKILENLAPGDLVVGNGKSETRLYVHNGRTLKAVHFTVSRA